MAHSVMLTGMTGRQYPYYVYAMSDAWFDRAGNYAFAVPYSRGILRGWIILYIGESENLKSRMSDHEKWAAATALGATHVLAHANLNVMARLAEERDLIAAYCPALNTQHRATALRGISAA